MAYHAKVIAGGKIVIPADLRRQLGIKDGDSHVVEHDGDGSISLKTFEQIVREEQRSFREIVGPAYTVDSSSPRMSATGANRIERGHRRRGIAGGASR